jgi:hypothetical protein
MHSCVVNFITNLTQPGPIGGEQKWIYRVGAQRRETTLRTSFFGTIQKAFGTHHFYQ